MSTETVLTPDHQQFCIHTKSGFKPKKTVKKKEKELDFFASSG